MGAFWLKTVRGTIGTQSLNKTTKADSDEH